MRALPPKVLRDLSDAISDWVPNEYARKARLLEALERTLKPRRGAAPARKRREAKKKTQRDAMASIRDAVLGRATDMDRQPNCEACRYMAVPLEVDHFFGGSGRRRELQSVETCWALCCHCHGRKTMNWPSAAYWLEKFIGHCERLGYSDPAEVAQIRLDAIRIQESIHQEQK